MSDFMSRSSVLGTHIHNRTAFDPANKDHLASLKRFLEVGNWGDVMFFPEFPFTDVPTYVLTKYASHQLKAQRKSNTDRATAKRAVAEEDAYGVGA